MLEVALYRYLSINLSNQIEFTIELRSISKDNNN